MRRTILVLMCTLLLTFPMSTLGNEGGMTEGSALDPLAQSDYDTAFGLMKTGRFLQAIEAFRKVIARDPNHAMAYTNMAYSYVAWASMNAPSGCIAGRLTCSRIWPKRTNTWARRC